MQFVCFVRDCRSSLRALVCVARPARPPAAIKRAAQALWLPHPHTQLATYLKVRVIHRPTCRVNFKPGKEMATLLGPRFPSATVTECGDTHDHTCREHPCHMISRYAAGAMGTLGLQPLTTVDSLNRIYNLETGLGHSIWKKRELIFF